MKALRTAQILAVATALISVQTAIGDQNAAFRTKNAEPGYWDVQDTWEVFDRSFEEPAWRDLVASDAIPGRDNRVTIQAGHAVVIDTEENVGHLVIQRADGDLEAGVVDIQADAQLTVHKKLDMMKRTEAAAPGRIVFSGTTGLAGVLEIRASTAISGDVEVEGRAGGVIRTDSPVRLISVGNRAEIRASHGALTIAGELEMDGRIVADGPYTITLTRRGPRSGSSGDWVVSNPAATIEFATSRDVVLASAGADIILTQGRVLLGRNFEFGGVIHKQQGRIEMSPGKEFLMKGRYDH